MKIEIKKILTIFIILLTITVVYIYNSKNYFIIRFDELGPLTKSMAVYYNGFKIGKIVRIEPDNDFKHTLVKVNILQKNINLPQNTTVRLQSFLNGEIYLEFVYPDSPSFKPLKRGDLIEGKAPYSLEQFMLGQNISGVTDVVSIHVIKALNATEVANMEMTAFFHNTSKLIDENRKGITASVNNTEAMTKSLSQMAENLNQTSQNLNQTSKKLNNALDEKTLKDTTLNIKDTTANISEATKDIDKTIKKIDDTVSNAKASAESLNSMTSGLNETLGKRFAGMRIIFGTPVKPKNP
jgi:ABC-type transporter Mla subunit MlaD